MGGAGYIMPSGPMTKVGIIGGGAVGGGGGAAAPGVNSVAPTLNLNSLAVAESFVAGFFSSAAAGAGAGAGTGDGAFFAPSPAPLSSRRRSCRGPAAAPSREPAGARRR